MKKEYISLGLMSGTSSDGIDASIIKSNGEILEKKKIFEILENQYFKYDNEFLDKILNLREKINNLSDLKNLERKSKLLKEN
jgi:anhydro-N-acetylmuramic acid kinase